MTKPLFDCRTCSHLLGVVPKYSGQINCQVILDETGQSQRSERTRCSTHSDAPLPILQKFLEIELKHCLEKQQNSFNENERNRLQKRAELMDNIIHICQELETQEGIDRTKNHIKRCES